MRIDLNSDLGESFGAYTMGHDELVIPSVTSVNVACGFHGGDPTVIQQTVEMAVKHNVAVGAHPGFPDLLGFGRRNIVMDAKDVYSMMIYQIGAVRAFTDLFNIPLQHVKPHGALNNMAAVDADLAMAIAKSIRDYDKDLILLAVAGTELAKAGEKVGLPVAQEVFADRNYEPNGTLRPRKYSDALIRDPEESFRRVLRMVQDHVIEAIDGTLVPVQPDSVCLHGDGPTAVKLAETLRRELTAHGVEVRSLASDVGAN
ncbi:5-oxoprolinase subunit PxpA [Alicyclobacillus tolerans]|uniref:LamB/YcsF family protein n=1 Tax=Alicyclobacillus tolerans TaxID=90970 RepID=UPI001F3FF919|nr:5-oxoprolinase subunit PxpA [Alicyclobacillus tolerans]MCF8567453.1 5-oxoprolinase subunit PxpA [Alicyclobacillus tolerans]